MVDHVRAAQVGDCRFLAEVMYDSMLPGVGHGIFDEALAGTGVDPISFNEQLLLAGASNWGELGEFLIVGTAGEPRAGAAAAYDASRPDKRPLTGAGFQKVSQRLGWDGATAKSFWARYVRAFGLFGDAPQLSQPAPYVVEYVAVRDNLRGRGLAGLLLRAHMERARSLGQDAVAVSAMYGNEAALRAYRRAGFQEHARLDADAFGGAFPGMVRLRLRLDPDEQRCMDRVLGAPVSVALNGKGSHDARL
jgi:ribosomal protein S18 acetylase RimI-like enzyme